MWKLKSYSKKPPGGGSTEGRAQLRWSQGAKENITPKRSAYPGGKKSPREWDWHNVLR